MTPFSEQPQTPPKKSAQYWLNLAEERIQAAQAAGEFERLPGFGKPIPGIDEAHDELWWVKDKLRREQIVVLPPALEVLRDIERTLAAEVALPSASAVRAEIGALNERICRARFAAAWGPSVNAQVVNIEEQVERWKAGKLAES